MSKNLSVKIFAEKMTAIKLKVIAKVLLKAAISLFSHRYLFHIYTLKYKYS